MNDLVNERLEDETQLDPLLQELDGIGDCVRSANWTVTEWNNPPDPGDPLFYVAMTSFELPLTSDVLYMVSNGSLSHGAVTIDANGDPDAEVVTVSVGYMHYHRKLLELADVCLLRRASGEIGVGIFVSSLICSCCPCRPQPEFSD